MKRNLLFVLICAFASTSLWAGVELTSAKIYKKQGEFAKAIEFYDQAVAKDPTDPEALFERGELLGQIAMDDQHVGLRKKVSGGAENPQLALLERMIKDFDAVRATGDEKKIKKILKKMDEQVQGYWWTFYAQAVGADSVYRANEIAFRELTPDSFVKVVHFDSLTAAIFVGDAKAADSIFMSIQTKTVNNGVSAAGTSIKLDPKHWSSRFVFAQLRGFQQKDEGFVKAWEEALEALENSKLKTEEPDNFTKNLEYGRLQLIQHYYAKQDFQNTLRIADLLLVADSSSVEAVQYKAFALATMAGDEARPVAERDSLKRVALGALNAAKEANKEDENILFYIGQFNLQLADTAAAMAAFDEFLVMSPNDAVVLAIQGVIFLEGGANFGDLKKAIEKLSAAKDAEPENGAYWTNYGIALLRDGKNEEGRKAMEKGAALSGN